MAAARKIQRLEEVDSQYLSPSIPIDVADRDQRALGQILLEDASVDPGDLVKALTLRKRQDARLGEILLAHDWVTLPNLERALSRQWRTNFVNLEATPADPRLIDAAGPELCLSHGLLPWRKIGGVTFVAVSRPEEFAQARLHLSSDFGTLRMLLCHPNQMRDAVLKLSRITMIREAEHRVPAELSCRSSKLESSRVVAATVVLCAAMGLILSPMGLIFVLTAFAVTSLVGLTSIKALALISSIRANGRALREPPARKTVSERRAIDLPVVSMMVPLFAEEDVARKLTERMSGLRYPRELTDLLIVIEETDEMTMNALAGETLPHWMRVVVVPDGPIKTKPRALNYALNFCRGQIVGIWDAEDRPEPDQLHKVVARFAVAPDNVACLQGALDYYNPRTNWLARCFTVEYATWFRAILPGMARLGMIVPLGGTTLFFRRPILEAIGAWDAWNVTEDADLGVRLARRGWRTEIIQTTTHEEANCRTLPWIKQRSRWIKGYAMTWGVHMRNPASLWRDLGPRAFFGFQMQFLGTLIQYLLAPVMWSFWLMAAGLPHPLSALFATPAGSIVGWCLTGSFIAAEAVNMIAGFWATRGEAHRHLWRWVPSLYFYHPLGCLAAWKAIYEVVTCPFYWDKTTHGLFDATEDETDTMPQLVELPIRGTISHPEAANFGRDTDQPVELLGKIA